MVLPDEMLGRRLKRVLSADIDALTLRKQAWGSKKNGELLEAVQHEFDGVFSNQERR